MNKPHPRQSLHFILAIFTVFLVVGCGKSPYDLASVHGRVTINGRAMSQGRVMFAPVGQNGDVNPGKPAFGVIELDGAYTLRTYQDNDGAVVGEHVVTVYDTSEKPKFTTLLLPERRTVVAGEENVIDIEITADEIRRYGRLASAGG